MTDAIANPVLLSSWRGETPEAWHRGAWCVVRDGSVIDSGGDLESPLFLRSAAKPFQCQAALESGLLSSYALGSEEISLACGSHGGESVHVDTALRILSRGGLRSDDLRCGAHEPLFPDAARKLRNKGGVPSALHNNCSGKHAVMLLAARHRGETLENYLDPDHPHQQRIRSLIARMAGQTPDQLIAAIDGCSAPTYALDLPAAATAWGTLLRSALDDSGSPAALVLNSIARSPFHIAGSKRFDSALTRLSGGRLIAKIGADGFYGALCRRTGTSLALHVDDGSWNASERILAALLFKHGLLDDEELGELRAFLQPERRNHAGLVVGHHRLEGEFAELRLPVS